VTTLGDRCIDALVRRIRQRESLQTDLVLVCDHPALADAPPTALVEGDTWRIARSTGELTLRSALPVADRVVVVVPRGFVPAADILGRCWLRRPLELRPDDVVAGLTKRPCEPIVDEPLSAAVTDALDVLRAHVDRFSAHGPVTATEIRSVLISATLGADARLDREPDWVLLSRWIREGLPPFRLPELLVQALKEAHPRTGRLLGWAAATGNLPALVAAGALDDALATQVPDVPSPRSSAERQDLRSMVEHAVRDAFTKAPQETRAALALAEKLVHQAAHAQVDPARMPLVKGALDRAIHDAAQRCRDGQPPEDATLAAFQASLHAGGQSLIIEQLRDIARLERTDALSPPSGDAGTVTAWAHFARDDVAHLDLALRRVRRAVEAMPPAVEAASRAALERAVERRDAWNRAFAVRLAADWPKVAASKDLAGVIGLHQVSRCILRPLINAGHRVCLVVLDGCDLSTFLEILLDTGAPLGLRLPQLDGSDFRDALLAAGGLQVALSPVPTVTSHSRRALFAGEIPNSAALQETEAAAANATADKAAFANNLALTGISKRLLLKGELGDGQALIDALSDDGLQLVAAVFNAVDDALSSKELTALPRFTFTGLGVRAAEALSVAAKSGWTIIVTADHGHTPCLSPDRRISSGALGGRFDTAPSEHAVTFEAGPLPRSPLNLLTAVGTWHGQQHRGFHGGAGLEEVCVPLAFLGEVADGEGRPKAPSWWWTSATVETVPAPAGPAKAPADVLGTENLLSSLVAELESIPRARPVLEALARHGHASADELAKLTGESRPFRLRQMLSAVLGHLGRVGMPAPFVEETVGDKHQYRWLKSKGTTL
jgi:hypothetical protein